MHNAANLTGQKFNRLTCLEMVGRNRFGQRLWRCACDCGGEITTLVQRIRSGATKSCGCWNSEVSAERARARSTVHNNSSRSSKSSEYNSWASMRARCKYPYVNSYDSYGGRGITVCERWIDFTVFLADMGPKPTPKHSIDRIDPNGNYESDNCRWANSVEQARNKRKPSAASPEDADRISRNLRKAVVARDGKSCRYCSSISGPFHVDHIIPRSRGGETILKNLAIACRACNLAKRAKPLGEWFSLLPIVEAA